MVGRMDWCRFCIVVLHIHFAIYMESDSFIDNVYLPAKCLHSMIKILSMDIGPTCKPFNYGTCIMGPSIVSKLKFQIAVLLI